MPPDKNYDAFGERLWPRDPPNDHGHEEPRWVVRFATKKNPKTAYPLGGRKFVASLRFLTCRGWGRPARPNAQYVATRRADSMLRPGGVSVAVRVLQKRLECSLRLREPPASSGNIYCVNCHSAGTDCAYCCASLLTCPCPARARASATWPGHETCPPRSKAWMQLSTRRDSLTACPAFQRTTIVC